MCAALAFSIASFGQKNVGSRESAKDIIEKAQNLILQRDRQQALTILSGALRREKGKPIEAEIYQALEQVSTVFLSDRAQQIYEGSISLRRVDLGQSQQRLQEALVMEPDNLNLVLEQARLFLAKSDCKAADGVVQAWVRKFSLIPSIKLLLAQIEVCQGVMGLYGVKASLQMAKEDSEKEVYWMIVAAEKAQLQKDKAKAIEISNQLNKAAPDYPDRQYWTWKYESRASIKNQLAEKYLMGCKNISAATYRQYMMDPQVCRRISEDDVDQKGSNAPTN